MFNERMQILLSPEQRRRLEAESARRHTSVAALVGEAIDARFEPVDRAQRRAAYEELARMAARSSAPSITP